MPFINNVNNYLNSIHISRIIAPIIVPVPYRAVITCYDLHKCNKPISHEFKNHPFSLISY